MSVRSGMADCAVALDALCLRIAPPESLDVTKLAHTFVTLARPRRRVPVTASMALRNHGSHAHGLPARTRYGSPRTAAREAPLWATQALGQVLGSPEGRAKWEANARRLGAYWEMSGWDHPGEAIGPKPSSEARAEWHSAFAAMAPVEGIDVRNLTDGQLLARRRAHEAEASWAPHHVAEELRAARKQEQFSRVEVNHHFYGNHGRGPAR